MRNEPLRPCVYVGRRGQRCGKAAVPGRDKCLDHDRTQSQMQRERELVKRELGYWGLAEYSDSQFVDPSETLMRLVTQSARRAELYASLLQYAFETRQELERTDELSQASAALTTIYDTPGVSALIGHKYAMDKAGNLHALEEAIRALTILEGEERDRLANFTTKAIAAGVATAQVRIAEEQGRMVVAVIRGVLNRLGLPAEQRMLADRLVPELIASVHGEGEDM